MSTTVTFARAVHTKVMVNVDGLSVGCSQHDDATMSQHALSEEEHRTLGSKGQGQEKSIHREV